MREAFAITQDDWLVLNGEVNGVALNTSETRRTLRRIRQSTEQMTLVCLPSHDPESRDRLANRIPALVPPRERACAGGGRAWCWHGTTETSSPQVKDRRFDGGSATLLDLEGTADAVRRRLAMPEEEHRHRMVRLHGHVAGYGIYYWVEQSPLAAAGLLQARSVTRWLTAGGQVIN